MSLVDLWFKHSEWWFDSNGKYDDFLTHKYEHLLEEEINYENEDPQILLFYILVHDQISRHVARVRKYSQNWIDSHTTLASQIADKFIQNKDKFEHLTPEQRVFVFLPYRHLSLIDKIKNSIDLVEKWRKEDDHPVYRRFYEASMRCYLLLVDNNSMQMEKETFIEKVFSFLALDIKSCGFFSFLKVALFGCFSFSPFKSSLYSDVEKNISGLGRNVVVSLSGGVDSMTVLNVCISMRNRKKLDLVSAVHIDYGNRIKSRLEKALISQYCKYHNIPLLIRKISEIKRHECERSFYEIETQKIRFRAYSWIINLLKLPESTPVLLGHNQDDRIENIFMNIRKKQHYDNLGGMDFISFKEGIKIVRPLLFSSKDEIIISAQQTGTIHTLNSTPSWSDRGRLRNELISFLNKFDSRIIPGLIDLVDHINDLQPLIEKNFSDWKEKADETTTNNNLLITIPFDSSIPFFAYKDFLISICYKHKIKIPSHRSIISCFKMIKANSNVRLSLSKDLIFSRENEKIIIIKKIDYR